MAQTTMAHAAMALVRYGAGPVWCIPAWRSSVLAHAGVMLFRCGAVLRNSTLVFGYRVKLDKRFIVNCKTLVRLTKYSVGPITPVLSLDNRLLH